MGTHPTWYEQTVDAIYVALRTSGKGITEEEAARRLKTYGPNELKTKKEPWWHIVIEPFKSVFVAVLIAAALVSLLTGEYIDATVIGIIIAINSVIFYSQQYATSRVLRSLRQHNVQSVHVIRNGATKTVSSIKLVPGDLLVLNEGERVPADARLIHVEGLQIDEASLTGESVPVHKHAATLQSSKQIYEQDNMLFQGTYVLAGTAQAIVVETGNRTEFGKIARLSTGDATKSPVQTKIDRLISGLIKIIGSLALVVFLLSLLRNIPASEALRFALSLTVSAVPEGLPVALTVIIVLGMRRMAQRKALVRSFKAIEDIGLVTTIATDKTGTLTRNHLSLVDIWPENQNDLIQLAAYTIDPNGGHADPLDQAIAEAAGPQNHAAAKVYPFDLQAHVSGAYVRSNGVLYVKGAPEHILSVAQLSQKQHEAAESAMHTLASKGYRVIALGTIRLDGELPDDLRNLEHSGLTFDGYIAFADELRPEAAPAIRAAHKAGITVRLITGDHYETAYNIGKQIGIAEHPGQVISGPDLPKNATALAAAVRDKTVFARIVPEDKFRILKALKKTEITAMTGDGVNDVPALTNAHVGIAMGSGSDVAKDAGSMILLDNNFATIIKAIAEGRKIFDNIRRMLFYLLATSLGEVTTMIGALLLGFPLPVTAIQILWINLVTDTAVVLPLGLEPEENGHMNRPPGKPDAPLLDKVLLQRLVLVGATMAAVTLSIVGILRHNGYTVAAIQTVAFMSLIVAQWMNAFNARSEYESSFRRLRKRNRGLIIGMAIAAILQMLVMFGPLRQAFGIQSVPLPVLLWSSGTIAAAVILVSEIHKFIIRQKGSM